MKTVTVQTKSAAGKWVDYAAAKDKKSADALVKQFQRARKDARIKPAK